MKPLDDFHRYPAWLNPKVSILNQAIPEQSPVPRLAALPRIRRESPRHFWLRRRGGLVLRIETLKQTLKAASPRVSQPTNMVKTRRVLSLSLAGSGLANTL